MGRSYIGASAMIMVKSMLIALFIALCVQPGTSRATDQKSHAKTIWKLNLEIDKSELTRPVELRITEEFNMTDQVIKAGNKIVLSCEAVGLPVPVIHWTFNGKRIENVEDTLIYEKLHNIGKDTIQNGITRAKLVVPCADETDSGRYKCVATNGHKIVEQSAHITIVGEPKECSNDLTPVINQWTDGRFENDGNAVQLMCRTQAGNSVAWYNENRELLNHQPEYEVMPNGDLFIKKGKWTMMGSYKCVASNAFGQDEITAFYYPTALE